MNAERDELILELANELFPAERPAMAVAQLDEALVSRDLAIVVVKANAAESWAQRPGDSPAAGTLDWWPE